MYICKNESICSCVILRHSLIKIKINKKYISIKTITLINPDSIQKYFKILTLTKLNRQKVGHILTDLKVMLIMQYINISVNLCINSKYQIIFCYYFTLLAHIVKNKNFIYKNRNNNIAKCLLLFYFKC